jgi:hypothetical protein
MARAKKNYTKRVFFPLAGHAILQQMGVPKPMHVAKSRSKKNVLKWI